MNARTSRALGALAGLVLLIGTGCAGEAPASRAVTVDTLPSSVVHVRSAADPFGRLWVVDWGNQRISVFDTTGALVADA